MAQKRSGTKKKKGKAKSRGKGSSGTIPWRNLAIVLFILVCVVIYLLIRYDLIITARDKHSPPTTPKQNLTLNFYYADPYSEKLAAEQRTIQAEKTIMNIRFHGFNP